MKNLKVFLLILSLGLSVTVYSSNGKLTNSVQLEECMEMSNLKQFSLVGILVSTPQAGSGGFLGSAGVNELGEDFSWTVTGDAQIIGSNDNSFVNIRFKQNGFINFFGATVTFRVTFTTPTGAPGSATRTVYYPAELFNF